MQMLPASLNIAVVTTWGVVLQVDTFTADLNYQLTNNMQRPAGVLQCQCTADTPDSCIALHQDPTRLLCCVLLQEVMGEGEQRDIVGRLLSRISNLQAAAVTAEATRRQLHNQMVELRGNVSTSWLCC
jgi:hypothetical protein